MDGVSERLAAGQSEGIEKLAAAVVAAQGEMTNPPKTKTVYAGQKRYSFAPLPEIIDAVRPVLTKHGLAVIQLVRERILETRLIHTSGQWIGAAYSLPSLADSQAMGSAISYARRYCLCAILGVAGEDDEDGEAATEAEQAAQEAKRKEAEKHLDELKAKGQVKSAYDGKVLAPGEATVPGERRAKRETDHEGHEERSERPKEETTKGANDAKADPFGGIEKKLADLMRREGITPEALKGYYVGKGHLPDTVDPAALPADYVAGLTRPENWKKAVTAIKGGTCDDREA